MQTAHLDDVAIDYQLTGSGEPLLFISPVLADGFVPLLRQPELTDHYRCIHYHRRGWVGSTHGSGTASLRTHASDAIDLLDHLGVPRAHVAGHSSGAAVAAELALDHPERVHTVVLLELSLLSLPEGRAFLQGAAPVFELYREGAHERAFEAFMTAVSGLAWATCRDMLEKQVPGMVDQSIQDADTFFGVELPSLAEWSFDAGRAASVEQPVLSVLGADTLPLWVEVAAFLRANIPDVREKRIDGVGHLLHIQRPEPVAAAIATFLRSHPIGAHASETLRNSQPA